MSSSNLRSAPTPLQEEPVDPNLREEEREEIEKRVKGYENIRSDLKNKSASTAYKKAKEAWKTHIDKDTWENHGLITRSLEEAYLSTRARLDIGGNNAKESETVGFFELWLRREFSENRFFLKSQFGVAARKGPEQQVDNLLGYITVHMLQQPLMMIEAKRHPKGREHMRPAELTALEDQVENYCRQWLQKNPDIPFLYAVTCASTEMRFWVMERHRDMGRAKMVGLWEPKKRTWAEYRDPGLKCDATIISAAIDLIKENPNGSDQALTTSSGSQSQSDRAPSAVPSRATRGTSESRRGTPSGDGRGDRTRSRDRSDDQPSSQEETPQQRSERHRQRDRGKESGTSDRQRLRQPSAPIDVPRSSSRREHGKSNTSIDEHEKLASSSSPEYPAQTPQTPIPIRDRERRERGGTEKGPSTHDGKRIEASSSSKPPEPRKRGFEARTNSLSTVPSTSSDDRNTSSSDNRAPRPKSTKKVGDASADAGRSSRSKRDKPPGSR